jgi:uncharacterized protein (TIGR02145 family)
MKKLILLFTITTFFLFSCSNGGDSDSNDGNTSSKMVDIEGNIYQTVTICNQIWTKTNLNVSRYRNGDLIPQVTDANVWENLTTGAWCYYNNKTSNGVTYGKLYNWYAVNDPRGLIPIGWHVQNQDEWNILRICLGEAEGGKMKEKGLVHWASPNTAATNSSGFTGLPGGARNLNGKFYNLGTEGNWWSMSQPSPTAVTFSTLSYDNDNTTSGTRSKNFGFSVRCLKD